MDDYVTVVALVSSAFFVALSFGLLFRYRQVSQKISSSVDLGRDLWEALDHRLKKQDERILDMMGRFEVVQSRVAGNPVISGPPASGLASTPPTPENYSATKSELNDVASQRVSQAELDETQKVVVRLLSEKDRNTIEIKDVIGRSREHTARLMKNMFDRGLVVRDDSKKPFVYRLTDMGRRYLSAS